ncbi:MAG: hypothetical protein HYY93_16555 [Planctomycetes bacterium]|nr:hypothetical protein [Planctomycetota bacterium]
MHLIALVKPVPDLANLSISRGQQAIFEKSKRLLNPADESAVEAALLWRAALGGAVTVLALVSERDIEVIRKPLAMGAEAAVAVVETSVADALSGGGAPALLLSAAIRKIAGAGPAVICCGPGGRPGGGSAQTGPRIAEALGWPCAVGVTSAAVADDSGLEVRERVRGGERTRRMTLPAVCVVDPAAFKPRAANALAIMKAVKRPVTRWTLGDLGLDPAAVEQRLAALAVSGRQLAEE